MLLYETLEILSMNFRVELVKLNLMVEIIRYEHYSVWIYIYSGNICSVQTYFFKQSDPCMLLRFVGDTTQSEDNIVHCLQPIANVN